MTEYADNSCEVLVRGDTVPPAAGVATAIRAGICRQCGQVASGGRTCTNDYHALLARERDDPAIGRYHGVVVPCYLLQLGDGTALPSRDIWWRMLEAFAAHGIDAVLRLQAHFRQQNSHRRRTPPDFAPLDAFAPLPPGPAPRSFPITIGRLAGPGGDFPVAGYDARVRAFVTATRDAWRHPRPASDLAAMPLPWHDGTPARHT
jgi:hypothetical protein